jgi:hypothetical protein
MPGAPRLSNAADASRIIVITIDQMSAVASMAAQSDTATPSGRMVVCASN